MSSSSEVKSVYYVISIVNAPELVSQDIVLSDKCEAANAASRLVFILRFTEDYSVVLTRVTQTSFFDEEGEFKDSHCEYKELEID